VANTIANVYVDTFEQNLRQVAQQETTKLMPHVQVRGEESENHNWELLGASDAAVKTTRLQATPVADTVWGRRVAVSQTWDNGESTEQEDPVQMMVDPNSNLVKSLGYSMRRAQDDVIITAATAAALNGDGSTTAFTAGQTVGDYTTAIDFDAITAVQEIFMNNDIDPSVPKVAVVGPTQIRKLMQLTENTSSDYVHIQALQDYGMAPNWLGFTWINSTRLLHPTAPGTDIDTLFFTGAALGMNVPKNITAKVAEDPSISFAWRLYCFSVMGAVRVQDEHIVRGAFADTL
jgi:hypothetical protein